MFRTKTREYDIVINNGYSEIDSITINIPPNFNIESLPKAVELKTEFGTFVTNVEEKGGTTIIYTQTVNIPEGRYDRSKYDDFKSFFQKISSEIKKSLVIKKSEV